MPHPNVNHPYQELRQASASFHDRFLGWVTDKVLASVVMFDAALIVPLLVLPLPNSAKVVLGVISSNWIQWWALPALQRSQNLADFKRDAKAAADHEAMTHMALTMDRVEVMVTDLHSISLNGGPAA